MEIFGYEIYCYYLCNELDEDEGLKSPSFLCLLSNSTDYYNPI